MCIPATALRITEHLSTRAKRTTTDIVARTGRAFAHHPNWKLALALIPIAHSTARDVRHRLTDAERIDVYYSLRQRRSPRKGAPDEVFACGQETNRVASICRSRLNSPGFSSQPGDGSSVGSRLGPSDWSKGGSPRARGGGQSSRRSCTAARSSRTFIADYEGRAHRCVDPHGGLAQSRACLALARWSARHVNGCHQRRCFSARHKPLGTALKCAVSALTGEHRNACCAIEWREGASTLPRLTNCDCVGSMQSTKALTRSGPTRRDVPESTRPVRRRKTKIRAQPTRCASSAD